MEQTIYRGITGEIIYLNEEKGWGFISSDAIKFEKIYFHWTCLVNGKAPNFKILKVGDKVRLDAHIKTNPNGATSWKGIKVETIGLE